MTRTFMPFRSGNLSPLEDLAREVDCLVHNMFEPEEKTQPNFTPHANLAETEQAYELSLDLPGLQAEDVSVELNDGKLIVSGERTFASEEEGKTFHRVERRYGKFRRVVKIPAPIAEDSIKAAFGNGVLTVTLPKSEHVKVKKIEIRPEAS